MDSRRPVNSDVIGLHMRMKKYLLLSAISGCAWAIIAYVLTLGTLRSGIVFGGLVASPLIGLLIGFIFVPVYRQPRFVQFALSLVTLYIAVALFGLCVGLYDAAHPLPNRTGTLEVIFESVAGCVMGVTFGYVVVLWPLAYFNHRLLARAYSGAR